MKIGLTPLIAALLWVGPALADPGNVNINVFTSQVFTDRITEVQVDGGGLHVFPDPHAAPELVPPDAAIAAALAALGYPAATAATVQSTAEIGADETFVEIVDASHNPIDDPTIVIGDPGDYLTWIAVSDVDVTVNVYQTTTTYTFHRLTIAIAASCGDGTVEAGEACDDGNTDAGDCCSATCQFEAQGSACDDDVVCTALDACDGAGACVSGGPATTCASAWAKASIAVNETKPGKEKLVAKLTGGPALGQGDFGNPLTGTTAYDVCLFDDAGNLAASFLVDRAADTCAGKPCWKAIKDTGWQYQDKGAAADGVTKAKLAGGVAGKSQIQVQAANNAKKGQLAMPTGIAAALQASASATLQVVTSDAQCFSVTVDEIKKQAANAFTGLRK